MRQKYIVFTFAVLLISLMAGQAQAISDLKERRMEREREQELQVKSRERDQESLKTINKLYDEQVQTNMFIQELIKQNRTLVNQNKTLIRQNADINDSLVGMIEIMSVQQERTESQIDSGFIPIEDREDIIIEVDPFGVEDGAIDSPAFDIEVNR